MTAANDTFTHVTLTSEGEARQSIVHGRIHETYRARNSRVPVTVVLDLDAADARYRRGLELVQLARAARVKTGDA